MSTIRPDEYVLPLVNLSNISRNLPAIRQAGMKSAKQSTVNLATWVFTKIVLFQILICYYLSILLISSSNFVCFLQCTNLYQRKMPVEKNPKYARLVPEERYHFSCESYYLSELPRPQGGASNLIQSPPPRRGRIKVGVNYRVSGLLPDSIRDLPEWLFFTKPSKLVF